MFAQVDNEFDAACSPLCHGQLASWSLYLYDVQGGA